MVQQVVIPIENSLCAVLSKHQTGVIELSFLLDGSSTMVPCEIGVTSSRFGLIRTAFNNHMSYVLGYHDSYIVRYCDHIVMMVEPDETVNVYVDTCPNQLEEEEQGWCVIKTRS